MSTPLERNVKARTFLYGALWVLGLSFGATQVGFAASNSPQPTWLTVALAVYAFIGAAVGYTAQSNVSDPVTVRDDSSPTGVSAGPASTLPVGTPVQPETYDAEPPF